MHQSEAIKEATENMRYFWRYQSVHDFYILVQQTKFIGSIVLVIISISLPFQ